jgi:DNA-binding NarL/FixJ family response regulator
MSKISVLLVDDHTVVRQGLAAMLRAQPDIEVVGEAEDGRQAIVQAKLHRPAVVLMDLAMPLLNGIQATRAILRELPGTKVLILSSYSENEYVKQAIEAGATGFLLKQTAANDLLNAIREVHRGNAFFSPPIARRLRDQSRAASASGRPRPRTNTLTAREVQVLQLISEGFSNKEMAAQLGISTKTVEKHRQQVMNKLEIHDIAGLTRYALTQKAMQEQAAGEGL